MLSLTPALVVRQERKLAIPSVVTTSPQFGRVSHPYREARISLRGWDRSRKNSSVSSSSGGSGEGYTSVGAASRRMVVLALLNFEVKELAKSELRNMEEGDRLTGMVIYDICPTLSCA
jgi:hypothetical protein